MRKPLLFSVLGLVVIMAVIGGTIELRQHNSSTNPPSAIATPPDAITAKITEIIDKPNQAEDGYYGFSAQDKDGKTYSINATGRLNSVQPEEESSTKCLDVPTVKVGDTISFHLPAGNKTDTNSLSTCYDKSAPSDYYLKLE